MSIFIFIISLAILILVHELGHFLAAKKFGIRVDEFGLGLPPKIFGKKLGETVYSVNWIPFGGFVKIFGEDPVPEQSTVQGYASENDKDRNFQYKPKWVQSLVLVAGVTFNIIFAWLMISLGFSLGFPAPVGYMGYETKNVRTMLTEIIPGSSAEKAGLRAGDVLVAFSDGPTFLSEAEISPQKISDIIAKETQNSVTIQYERGGKSPVSVSIKPEKDDALGRMIVGMAMEEIGIIKLPIHRAFFEGARTTLLLTKETAIGLGKFLYNAVIFKANLSQVTGPVGIAGTFGQARELGLVFVLSLTAVISINLALINLIPFPALDGGRLFFILIEKIIRRPIPPKIFQWVNATGFAVLVLLMIVITGRDIARLL